jgi:hypothetical protein
MNIELLARNAINKIKSTWGIPDKGFIAVRKYLPFMRVKRA